MIRLVLLAIAILVIIIQGDILSTREKEKNSLSSLTCKEEKDRVLHSSILNLVDKTFECIYTDLPRRR